MADKEKLSPERAARFVEDGMSGLRFYRASEDKKKPSSKEVNEKLDSIMDESAKKGKVLFRKKP